MKKMITLLLILVLTLSLITGCRNGTTPEDMATDASEALNDITPKIDNARPTDGDGFIGDGNDSNGNSGIPGNGGMMPNG